MFFLKPFVLKEESLLKLQPHQKQQSTNLGECVCRVVTESADIVAGIVKVVRVAPERSVVTQVLAVLLAINGLPHGVHSLQDLSLDLQKAKIHLNLAFSFFECCNLCNTYSSGCHVKLQCQKERLDTQWKLFGIFKFKNAEQGQYRFSKEQCNKTAGEFLE